MVKSIIQILHVDDDENFLKLIKLLFSIKLSHKWPNTVIMFNSVKEPKKVFEHVKNFPYDIILSDLNMHDIDGIELFLQLRKEGCKTPFLLLTSNVDEKIDLTLERLRIATIKKTTRMLNVCKELINKIFLFMDKQEFYSLLYG